MIETSCQLSGSYILKAVAFGDLRRINYHVGADEVVAFWDLTTINQSVIVGAFVKKCVLRVRPQGGRAVFIVLINIDRAWNDDSNGGIIVDSGQNPNLGMSIWFGAHHSDCRGRFSWVDWQKDRCLASKLQPIDRARRDDSKSPLIAFRRSLQAYIFNDFVNLELMECMGAGEWQ